MCWALDKCFMRIGHLCVQHPWELGTIIIVLEEEAKEQNSCVTYPVTPIIAEEPKYKWR